MGNTCDVGGYPHCSADQSFESVYDVDDNIIGSGKFSEVFLCWRRNAPFKKYALKVINTAEHNDIERVHEEIKVLRILGSHNSIIQLIDVDERVERDFIRVVTELAEGGELYDRIRQIGFFVEDEARLIIWNLVDAVAYIHSKGIMHRDLKPENILMVSPHSDTDIKISDFGLAKLSTSYPRRLPRSNSICGSDYYLAPEVIRQEEYGREIDVWSVGVVSYVIMCGSLPFYNENLAELYRQIVKGDPGFAQPQWQHVTQDGKDFLMGLLQVSAGDRWTAEEALEGDWFDA